MKKRIILLLSCLLFCFLTIACLIIAEQDCLNTVCFTVKSNTNERIYLFQGDKLYAFLPAYAKLDMVYISCETGCTVFIDNKIFNSDTNCSSLLLEKEYTLKIKNSLGRIITKKTLVILQSKNIPTLSIQLVDGSVDDLNKDKSVSKTGYCNLIEAEGNVAYSGTFDEIHGRGGYTWTQAKKPYNISFRHNVDLLGMGAAKEWVLLSNSLDMSNLRNKLVYDTASLFGLKYSVESRFVDLYIQDEYYGLYVLAEKIEINPYRVNINNLKEKMKSVNKAPLSSFDEKMIEESNGSFVKYYDIDKIPTDISGGYIIELQHYAGKETYSSSFATDSKTCFEIKSLPYASYSQVEYLSETIEQMEESFAVGTYKDYIDVESWVKYYLIQEVFGNMDNRSFFYYKDSDLIDSKIYAGPVWDFDVSWGNHAVGPEINPKAFYINTWGYYSILYKDYDFKNEIILKYETELKPLLEQLIAMNIDIYAEEIRASYLMNQKRWENIQDKSRSDDFDSLNEHTTYLKNYLQKRIGFLDEIWLLGKDVCTITATSKANDAEYTHKYFYSIEKGSVVDFLPNLEKEGYCFDGWYNQGTEMMLVPGEKVNFDTMYVAKWSAVEQATAQESTSGKLIRIVKNNHTLIVCLTMFSCLLIFITFCIWVDFKKKKRRP